MSTNNIDMFGWQTVFAVTYDEVNKAIKAAGSTPASFEQTDPDTQLKISGTWSDWSVATGGDGVNLLLACPVKTGTAHLTGGDLNLAGGTVHIEVKLAYVPNPDASVDDPTGSGGTPHDLSVKASGSLENPAVVVTGVSYSVTNARKGELTGLFTDWFNAHIDEFNHVFATLVLNEKADRGDYQWLKPTHTGYGVASPTAGVFGVLCMTDVDPEPGQTYQVDGRLLEKLPAGSNSAFAISSGTFLENIMIRSAVYCLHGSKDENFDVTDDNEWIVNNTDLRWGDFKLDSGAVVTPKIREENFRLGFQGGKLVIQITDATFNWPEWHGPGNITVHVNLAQEIGLQLKKVDAKGGWVLVPDPGVATKSMSTNVTTDAAVLTFDVCMGIGGAVIGAILGAVAGAALQALAEVSVESGTNATIQVTEQAIQQAVDEVPVELVEEAEQQSADAAVQTIEATANPTRTFAQSFSTAFQSNKWKLIGGLVGSILGGQLGVISKYVQIAASNNVANLPTLNAFAENCVGATTWPDTDSWTPTGVRLPGAFVLTGALS